MTDFQSALASALSLDLEFQIVTVLDCGIEYLLEVGNADLIKVSTA
jgi:hypothetical protein